MTYWVDLDEPRRLQDIASRRSFGLTLALSLLVHILALFGALHRINLLPADEGHDKVSDRLEVRLAAPPPPARPPMAAPATPSVALPKVPTPRIVPRKPQPPPVLAVPTPVTPAPKAPVQLPQPPSPPTAQSQTPARPAPAEPDLWSYLQARRRERGEAVEPLPSGRGTERNVDLAANLPRPATGTATRDVNRGGGIFEIKRMTYDDAAFVFFGWNPDMGRETPQLITVRIGHNENMRIAVVRRMIALIRDYTQTDFVWRSGRSDRGVMLSARVSDNAELEAYLMREFFDERGDPH